MACCLFAAFLIAQCLAMIRRWGIFWGLVAASEYEDGDTIYRRLAAWLRRPAIRAGITAIVLVELVAVGAWVKVEHGDHLLQLTESTIAGMRGEPPPARTACTKSPHGLHPHCVN